MSKYVLGQIDTEGMSTFIKGPEVQRVDPHVGCFSFLASVELPSKRGLFGSLPWYVLEGTASQTF